VTPTVELASRRRRGIGGFIARWPLLTTAVAGLMIGYAAIAVYLLPGITGRAESAVPNVVGLLYDDAAARLGAAGFTVRTGESLNHPTTPRNSVLGQNPAPGVKGLKGDEVLLDVSLGPRKGIVPDVIGLPRDEAIKTIEAAGFETPKEFIERIDPNPRGEVLGTLPRSGLTVTLPSTVRLTISAGPDAIGLPSMVGMPLEDALALLAQLGLTSGAARFDTTRTQPEGYVAGQRPAANTPVPPGAVVTLTISRPPASAEPIDPP